jgi:hypothetical protein
MRSNPFGVRADLRDMPTPTAIAYVVITVVTLLAKTLGYVFGLIAEITERLADSGYAVRADLLAQAIAEHETVTAPAPFTRPATRTGTGTGTRR